MLDLSPETERRVYECAAAAGMSVDAYISHLLDRYQETIILSERDFAAFVEAINRPATPPTPSLLSAVAEYKHRHAENNIPTDVL